MSYVTDVADLFLTRCRSVKILSPMDYATIAEWEKQEIPLIVVFDSLNRIFENLSKSNEPVDILSISHFHNEVKKNYADWLQSLKVSP